MGQIEQKTSTVTEPMAPARVYKCIRLVGTLWFHVDRNRRGGLVGQKEHHGLTDLKEVSKGMNCLNCRVTDSKSQR